MAEGELLVSSMLSITILLAVISAVRRYTITLETLSYPGVTILMFLGAILAGTPIIGFEVDEFTISLKDYQK